MPINFPSSPTLNQTYTEGLRVRKYNGVAWAVYRQALRDITAQEGFPTNVIWPQEPELSN